MEKVIEKTEQLEKNKYKEKSIKKIERSSNLELLRILAMILIIGHHYILHSNIQLSDAIPINKYIISFLELGGKLGVNLFILITGYFLIEKQFKAKKVVKLVIKTVIYSIICLIVITFAKKDLLSLVSQISSFIPVMSEAYWFMTTYILLYLFHPYINKLFSILDKKEIEKILIVLFVIWSVIPTFTLSNFGFNNLGWFIYIYLLGGYIRVYGNTFLEKRKIHIVIIAAITIILTIIPTHLANLKTAYDANKDSITNIIELYYLKKGNSVFCFNELNGTFILILAISYFGLFKNIKMKSNKVINSISGHTLGIYLFHDNMFMRDFIWKHIVNCSWYIKSKIFIVNAICVIPAIFIIGLILDYAIDFILERNIYKIIEKIYLKVKNIISEKRQKKTKKLA